MTEADLAKLYRGWEADHSGIAGGLLAIYRRFEEEQHDMSLMFSARHAEWPQNDPPDASYADLIETLTDLARAGHETEFRELAAMRNVPAHQLDALWTGTVRRVRPQPPTTKGTP